MSWRDLGQIPVWLWVPYDLAQVLSPLWILASWWNTICNSYWLTWWLDGKNLSKIQNYWHTHGTLGYLYTVQQLVLMRNGSEKGIKESWAPCSPPPQPSIVLEHVTSDVPFTLCNSSWDAVSHFIEDVQRSVLIMYYVPCTVLQDQKMSEKWSCPLGNPIYGC